LGSICGRSSQLTDAPILVEQESDNAKFSGTIELGAVPRGTLINSDRGWPKVFSFPTETKASFGAAAVRNAGVVDERLPWCPTFNNVTGSTRRNAIMASAAVSRRTEADPY